MNFTQEQAIAKVSDYFSSSQFVDFVEELKRGDEVRHAHLYIDSCLSPVELGKVVEAYFEKKEIPIQRALKYLPIAPDLLNIYNVMPKGMCHFEFFLRYNEEEIIAPMPPEYSREKKNASFWDDAYMKKFYKQYSFKKISKDDKKEIKKYFFGDDFRYCYRMMIDEYRALIHSHGLIETSYHPEELIPYGVKSFEEMGVEVQKAVSVVFNCNGKDMPKMVFLLRAPETVVEVEWHYNPRIGIKPADPRFYRLADTGMFEKYNAARKRLVLSKSSIEKIVASF